MALAFFGHQFCFITGPFVCETKMNNCVVNIRSNQAHGFTNITVQSSYLKSDNKLSCGLHYMMIFLLIIKAVHVS